MLYMRSYKIFTLSIIFIFIDVVHLSNNFMIVAIM